MSTLYTSDQAIRSTPVLTTVVRVLSTIFNKESGMMLNAKIISVKSIIIVLLCFCSSMAEPLQAPNQHRRHQQHRHQQQQQQQQRFLSIPLAFTTSSSASAFASSFACAFATRHDGDLSISIHSDKYSCMDMSHGCHQLKQKRQRQRQHSSYSRSRYGKNNRNSSSSSSLKMSASTTTATTTSSSPSSSSSFVPLQMADYSHDKSQSIQESSSSQQKQHHLHPPVLFLHGLLGSKRNFASLGTTLGQQLEKPRQIFAVDLRNHGDNNHHQNQNHHHQLDDDYNDDDNHDTSSTTTTTTSSLEMNYHVMALDVVQVLDHYDIPQVVLVGHSMGGKVAQAMALLYPHRVAGLVVLDMAPVKYEPHDMAWKAVRDIIQLLAHDISLHDCPTKRHVDILLRESLPDPALRAFVLTNLNDGIRKKTTMTNHAAANDEKNHQSSSSSSSSLSVEWKIPMQTIASQLDILADFNISTDLSYDKDVFFIHGGQSKFVRASHIPIIAQYFPSHLITTIRGAGHWLHAEAPNDVVALLKKYLDR